MRVERYLSVAAVNYDYIGDDEGELSTDATLKEVLTFPYTELYSLADFIAALNDEYLSDQNHFWLVDLDEKKFVESDGTIYRVKRKDDKAKFDSLIQLIEYGNDDES